MSHITPFAQLDKRAADIKEIAKETAGAGVGGTIGTYGGLGAGALAGLALAPKNAKLYQILEYLGRGATAGTAAGAGIGGNVGAELAGSERGGVGANVGGTLGGALGSIGGLTGGSKLEDLARAKGKGASGLALLAALLGGVGGTLGGRALGKQAE